MISKIMRRSRLKKDMIRAFYKGGLYELYKKGMPVYPRIHNINVLENQDEVIFSPPFGLDPEKIEGSFIFSQTFGDDIKLEKENKVFRLTISRFKLSNNLKVEQIQNNGWKIPLGISKYGETVYLDLGGPFPHAIVAGTTNGGKSTMLRLIVTSLALLNNPPSLYLCDLKGGVELGIFRDLSCTKRFEKSLDGLYRMLCDLQVEMNRSYDYMFKHNQTDWSGNYCILVLDEMIDIKNRSSDEKDKKALKTRIKELLDDLVSKGRSARVWLILGTQRPDSLVIDGSIKANINNKLCFYLPDSVQSQIVLDNNSASDLPDIPGRCIYKRRNEVELQTFHLSRKQAEKLLDNAPRKVIEVKPSQMKRMEEDKEDKRVLGVLDDA